MWKLAVVLVIQACSSTDAPTRCTRAVAHVMDLMAAESKLHVATPSPDEQRAMDDVAKRSIAQCEAEGFTLAQLDCLLAATDWAKYRQVGTCPAIHEKPPTWLQLR